MEEEYINMGKIDLEKIGKYKEMVITDDVILTYERLNNHINLYHKKEYEELEDYIYEIIKEPDYILEDNLHIDTLIYLKDISSINKKARIVVRLATDKNNEIYNKNSIITIMRQREKSWQQTLKNRGKIIFQKTRQN